MNIRIPSMIHMKGRGLINPGSTLLGRPLEYSIFPNGFKGYHIYEYFSKGFRGQPTLLRIKAAVQRATFLGEQVRDLGFKGFRV